jgi:hypothetical protein
VAATALEAWSERWAARPVDGDDAIVSVADGSPDGVSWDGATADGGATSPLRRPGRAGTALGRAVHAVLQVTELDPAADVSALARAEAEAEGIAELADAVVARVGAALRSDPVRTAAAAPRHWRELHVAVPLDGRVLEGFVDLVYEDRAGALHLVDYKTDGVRSAAAARTAVDRYRLQGGAYALALAEATGRPVLSCTFLFLSERGDALPCPLADLAGAAGDVRALLRSGEEPRPPGGRGGADGPDRPAGDPRVAPAERPAQLRLFDPPAPVPGRSGARRRRA